MSLAIRRSHDPRSEVEWRTDRELVVRVPDPDGLVLQTILFSDVHISVEALHKKPVALSPETDTLQR